MALAGYDAGMLAEPDIDAEPLAGPEYAGGVTAAELVYAGGAAADSLADCEYACRPDALCDVSHSLDLASK